MPATLHRQTPNRARELRERVWALVEQKLAGLIICPECKATYKTFEDECTADLGRSCPGADAIGAARQEAEREIVASGSAT